MKTAQNPPTTVVYLKKIASNVDNSLFPDLAEYKKKTPNRNMKAVSIQKGL
jgi:hypothetical protein